MAAEVAVRRPLPSSIPNIDSLEGFATEGNDEYSTFKKLQRQLEYVATGHQIQQQLTSLQVHQLARGVHQRRAEVRS